MGLANKYLGNFVNEEKSKDAQAIQALIDIDFSASDEEKGKAAQMLKGLFFSDSPEAKAFIGKLDKMLSGMKMDEGVDPADQLKDKINAARENIKKLKDQLSKAEGDSKVAIQRKIDGVSRTLASYRKMYKDKFGESFEELEEESGDKIKKMEAEVARLRDIKSDLFGEFVKEKEKYGSSDEFFHKDITTYRKLKDAHSDAVEAWEKAYDKLEKMKKKSK
jgi:hypothetical protein